MLTDEKDRINKFNEEYINELKSKLDNNIDINMKKDNQITKLNSEGIEMQLKIKEYDVQLNYIEDMQREMYDNFNEYKHEKTELSNKILEKNNM